MNKKFFDISEAFKQKKYREIIEFIEKNIEESKRSSQILNILATCKILDGPVTKDILISTINIFKQSYLQDKKTNHALDALRNFINFSVNLFDFDKSKENQIHCKKLFILCLNYYKYTNDLFKDDKLLLLAITRIYKRFSDIDNVIANLSKLIKNDSNDSMIYTSYIYYNSFKSDWSQNLFYQNSTDLAKKLPIYSNSELKNLNKKKKDKIYLGFLSSDIRGNHSITYFLETILKNYNKEKFKIFLFTNLRYEDDTTLKFSNYSDVKINIGNLNNLEVLNLIRENSIDVMIDMMGMTSSNRIALFKNRLAPIQISWCGYCNTTGLSEMDYLITDKNLIYDNEHSFYSEKILYLNDIWNAHRGFEFTRKQASPPSVKNNYFTFGSFNNFSKINDKVIEVWSEILKKVENSKLMLKTVSSRDVELLSSKFEKKGVIKSIKFLPKQKNFKDHLDLYNEIDLALDTFPYNGVTTSFEAIWMGVPVLTMEGYNFNSRCGESINKNLNIDYLISKNHSEYVEKATELSKNKVRIKELRDKVFNDSIKSPLFDTNKFNKNFFSVIESVYKKLFN